jgi:hypothetical protein
MEWITSPLLNFVLGNLIGLSEIDVQSVELLPEPLLYGANALMVFCSSKSPSQVRELHL